MKNIQNQKGLTLIELMIASTLGLIVLLGVTSALTAMTRSSITQVAQNDTSQTATFAFNYISGMIRGSGSSACESARALTDSTSSRKSIFGPLKKDLLQSVTPLAPENISIQSGYGGATITASSDRFMAVTSGAKIPKDDVQIRVGSSITLVSPLSSDYHVGDDVMFMMTDCETIDTFVATINSSTEITPTGNLAGPAFSIDTILSPMSQKRVSVKESAGENDLVQADRLCNSVDDPVDSYGLSGEADKACSGVNFNNDQPVLPGVELMRVVYGVDNNNAEFITGYRVQHELDPNLPFGQPNSAQNVVSMTVYLLIKTEGNSIDPTLEGTYSLRLPDTSTNSTGGDIQWETLSFSDQVPRKVFSKTFTLRNKVVL